MKHDYSTHTIDARLSEPQARRLLEEFFDGATSTAQERMLYDYFRTTPDLPADLRRYGLMMGWLEEGMPEPAVAASAAPRRRPFGQIIAIGASVAAMLAVVVTLGVGYSSRASEQYALYEGSYVVTNGHRETDLRTIMPRLQRTEALAEAAVSDASLREVANMTAADDDMAREINDILDI